MQFASQHSRAAQPAAPSPDPGLSFGVLRLDRALGGGLPADRLHEFRAAGDGDWAAASAVALLLARQARGRLLWISERRADAMAGHAYAPGLLALGLDPDAMILVHAKDRLAALRAGLDGLRSGAAGAVLIALWGEKALPDLAATRRLSLAAQRVRAPALLLTTDMPAFPTAAWSRWRIASAPSRALAADTPGHPAFDLALMRHRGGLDGLEARLEWNHDTALFREIAPSRPLVPAAALRPAANDARHIRHA